MATALLLHVTLDLLAKVMCVKVRKRLLILEYIFLLSSTVKDMHPDVIFSSAVFEENVEVLS